MNDSQFHQLVDQLILELEEILETYGGEEEIDYEVHGGSMTLYFTNDSKIVITRQEPLHQIWLATKGGAYHFDYRNNTWYCNRSGKAFYQLLSQACSEQAGTTIVLR